MILERGLLIDFKDKDTTHLKLNNTLPMFAVGVLANISILLLKRLLLVVFLIQIWEKKKQIK